MKLSFKGVSKVSAQVWASRLRWVSLPGVSTMTKSAAPTAGSSAAASRARSSASASRRSFKVEIITAACSGIGSSMPFFLA